MLYLLNNIIPVLRKSSIFMYIGWICLSALIVSVTIMSLISDLLNPKLIKSTEKNFIRKSVRITIAGFLLACFVSLIFCRSQQRESTELWTVFWSITIHVTITGLAILVISLSRGNESKIQGPERFVSNCCHESSKNTENVVAAKLNADQVRDLGSQVHSLPLQYRNERNHNSTCAPIDLSENKTMTNCSEDKPEADTEEQGQDTVSQPCCSPFCFSRQIKLANREISCESTERAVQVKSSIDVTGLETAPIADDRIPFSGKLLDSPCQIEINIPLDLLSPKENSRVFEELLEDSQC